MGFFSKKKKGNEKEQTKVQQQLPVDERKRKKEDSSGSKKKLSKNKITEIEGGVLNIGTGPELAAFELKREQKRSAKKPAYKRTSSSLSRDPDYLNRLYGMNEDRFVGTFHNPPDSRKSKVQEKVAGAKKTKKNKKDNKTDDKENLVVFSAKMPRSSATFRQDPLNTEKFNPRDSQFQPRTTLAEPPDPFPYKLGRESVPRRSTLYHGIDYDEVKNLTDDQLRRSLTRRDSVPRKSVFLVEDHRQNNLNNERRSMLRSKEDYERPSTSKSWQNSYTLKEDHRHSSMQKTEEHERPSLSKNNKISYVHNDGDLEHLGELDPHQKTVMRFRPQSAGNFNLPESTKLMVFRADQVEQKLFLGKHVHTIPLKHKRHVPTLLTDDGKILEPVEDKIDRKSILKTSKTATPVKKKVTLTEIENVGKCPRKSMAQLDEDGLRKSLRKSYAPHSHQEEPRESVTRKSFVQIELNPHEADQTKPNNRYSIVPVTDIRQSMRKSVNQEREGRLSIVRVHNNQDIDLNNNGTVVRDIEPDIHFTPVIPARIDTSKSIIRHSMNVHKPRASLENNRRQNSINPNWNEHGRKSVISNTPNTFSEKKKHSIVVLNVGNPNHSPFNPNKVHYSANDDRNSEEEQEILQQKKHREKVYTHQKQQTPEQSFHTTRQNHADYFDESSLIQKYSEYYKSLSSPDHYNYTAQILNPLLSEVENKPKKTNKKRSGDDNNLYKDFCGLTEMQKTDPRKLQKLYDLKVVSSIFDSGPENDIDSLCIPASYQIKKS